uniref:Uncharacterized protein n=1 Tax=Anguilla anguilla TaxID=7936 RepID=A0A0E9X989_ANGAN
MQRPSPSGSREHRHIEPPCSLPVSGPSTYIHLPARLTQTSPSAEIHSATDCCFFHTTHEYKYRFFLGDSFIFFFIFTHFKSI